MNQTRDHATKSTNINVY